MNTDNLLQQGCPSKLYSAGSSNMMEVYRDFSDLH